MKRKSVIFTTILAFSIGVSFAALQIPTVGLSPEGTGVETLTEGEVEDALMNDSIIETRRIARLVKGADESYRRLKTMRLNGYDERDYYPELIECFEANVAAIDSLPGHPRVEISKAVILDTYKDLLDGAYYYSGLGNSGELTRFAQAYLDVADMPSMAGENVTYNGQALPTLAYICASGAYNNKQFEDAIRYFVKYLSTPDQSQRENVYTYLGQACLYAKDYDRGVSSMAEGAVLYPSNYNLLTLGLQACIDGAHGENIPFFLDKALQLKPNDEQLLNIQGQMFEDNQEYRSALDVYQRLDEMKPNNLGINKHLALCYFNLGVHHYNEAIMSGEEKVAKRNKRQSNAYFSEAAVKLNEVLANDPLSVKYLRALAITYGCQDDKEKFEEVNTRLRALGQEPEKSMMPSMMVFKEDNSSHFTSSGGNSTAFEAVPAYSEFGQGYVTDGLAKWAARGPYEKMEDYTKRVTDANAQTEYTRLCKESEKAYIDKYARKLRINDMRLGGYDPDNETYLVETEYGDIALKVPMKNKEAEVFAATWDKVQPRAPRFYIKEDKPTISQITFVTNAGKSYTYDAADASTYAYTDVIVDFGSILKPKLAANNTGSSKTPAHQQTVITRLSDVDKNIPVVKRSNDNTVVLILANENYENVSNVASAIHDGEVFREYSVKTLGVPEQRVKYIPDATLAKVYEGIAFAKNAVKAIGPDANLIVYYAGHGMPNESTKDAYLIPVDGNVTIPATCLALEQLYTDINNLGIKSSMIFLDACFSGARRGEGMLVGARGIAMKPKAATPKGNMFVLSAASGDETAMPYDEMNHGMFTYFLLKKLQDSKGNATLKEISDYVKKNVIEQSNLVNKKAQTPQTTLSGNMSTVWSERGLRE